VRDTAFECHSTLRAVYHLTQRAADGFVRSGFDLMRLSPPVPDCCTSFRRAEAVRVTLPTRAEGLLHRVPDSDGMKVSGEGEWKVRQHVDSGRRPWRKPHLAIVPKTNEVQAADVCEPGVTDAEAVPCLMRQVENPVESGPGVRECDRRVVYAELDRLASDVRVRRRVMNIMTQQGMPETIRVAAEGGAPEVKWRPAPCQQDAIHDYIITLQMA